MKAVLILLSSIKDYKIHTAAGIFFHLLTAVLTVVSIPLVIPFFQIIFGQSPSDFTMPTNPWDVEKWLNYGFSRLVAMSDSEIALKVVCISVVVIFLFKNLFRFLNAYFMVAVRNGIAKELRFRLWRSMESLSIADRKKYEKGHLLTLMSNDLSEIDHGILNTLEFLFRTPLIVIASLIFMYLINLKLFLISMALILFSLLIVGRVSQLLKKQSVQLQSIQSSLLQSTDELLSSLRILWVYDAIQYFRNKFQVLNNAHYVLNNKMVRRRDLASPLAEFLGVASVVCLLYFGTIQVLHGEIAAASFFAFIYAFYNVIDPAKSFSKEYSNFQRGLASLSRVNDFIGGSTGLDSSDSTEIIKTRSRESICFKKVYFSYPERPDHLVLEGFDLEIKASQKMAIVGSSGAGKSCIIDLLLRFYEPESGQVEMDGKDIKNLDLKWYRSLFSYISQEPILFNQSWIENITLDDASKLNQVLYDKVLTITDLHDIIDGRLLQSDSKIGDQGMYLSGGEKQRICIARALYKNSEFIILDEPTSSLDNISEKKVIDSILNAMKERSSIIITHNINILKEMDVINVLDAGHIVQSGTYSELSQSEGLFKNLIKAQTED